MLQEIRITLESIISRSYPYLLDNEKTDDCVDRIKEYAEDSLPVLTQEGKIAGIITSSDVVEMVDDAMGDDYAKLGGLTAEEDLNETTVESMKKKTSMACCIIIFGNVSFFCSRHVRSGCSSFASCHLFPVNGT